MPIVSPIKNIIDAIVKIIELIILLVTKIPEILMMAFEILNPINIINDSITGHLYLKVVIVGLIDTRFHHLHSTQPIQNVKILEVDYLDIDVKKRFMGKIVKNSCGDGKMCKRNVLVKYIIAVLCPPLALALHLGMKGFFRFDLWILYSVYVLFSLD